MLSLSLGKINELGAKKPIVVLLGMVFAFVVAISGGLLIFQPDMFLKLYDWLNPGDYWGRNAGWRKDVRNTEYKILGVVLLSSGLLFLALLAKALPGNL